METWKEIIGYKGLYMISDHGNVMSLFNEEARYLKMLDNGKGYKIVYLYKNGVRKMFRIHRLVAIHFIPNPNNLPEVNHKYADKSDNRATSLEWSDKLNNMRHAERLNLITRHNGSNNKNSKKVFDSITGSEYVSITDAASKIPEFTFKQIRSRISKNIRFSFL